MQSRSAVLRFLHASNLRLGQVVSGVGRVSSDLKQTLVEAPWQAATSIFDEAIARDVDFVLLNGDVVPEGIQSGRAIVFLVQQFARLRQHGINVYWRTASIATAGWGSDGLWPDNVEFVSDDSEEVLYTRHGKPLAAVASGLRSRSFDGFSIALTDGDKKRTVGDYIAGCELSRDDSVAAGRTVHHPGIAQGLGFHEAGPVGCSLVELDQNNTLSIGLIETAAVRWDSCRLSVPAATSTALEDLARQLILSRLPTTGPLVLFRLTVDVEDTAAALGLESADLLDLCRRLQPTQESDPAYKNYRMLSVSPGAGMLVAGESHHDGACVGDFRQLVHRRGQDCVEALQRRRAYQSETPQLQLLNGVARLGRSLLS